MKENDLFIVLDFISKSLFTRIINNLHYKKLRKNIFHKYFLNTGI